MDPKFIILSLITLGLLLLYLEIYLPGWIAGTLGAVCLMASVLKAYQWLGPGPALVVLLLDAILVGLGLAAWSRYFPQSKLGRRMILTTFSPPPETIQEESLHLGQEGKAVTELRPAGTAEFNGHRFDVVAESSFIPSGDPVKVLQIEKYRVVVRKLDFN